MIAPLLSWDTFSPVKSIAMSRDGSRIVSGSDDGHVRVWDVQTGALVLEPLEGHSRRVGTVALSHDDTLIISGSDDCTIRVWYAPTGVSVGEPLKGHAGAICSVALSHDSTRIVSGSYDDTIRIWDMKSRASVSKTLKGHRNVVSSVAFSSDSARIVSGSWDRTIRIWDAHTGEPVGKPLKGHKRSIYSIAFSPDSSRIASGSWDCTVRLWDAYTGAPIGAPLKGHADSVSSVTFSFDGTHVISGSFDNTVRTWDARTGAPVGEVLKGHSSVVHSSKFSSGSIQILSASLDQTIRVWKHITMFDEADSNLVSILAGGHIADNVFMRVLQSIQKMFHLLIKHGCKDLTQIINFDRPSAVVGSGGFGDVWRLVMGDGIDVAMKTSRLHIVRKDNKVIKSIVREAYNWSKLRHENIQELLGVTMFHGQLGLVSLWMENGNLQQYITTHPDVERYSLCVQLVTGVAYLHIIGMVHGNLKSLSVLVSGDGIVKIADFGHSLFGGSLRFTATTNHGGGTVRWMAPELLMSEEEDANGDNPIVSRSTEADIYALGMTMLETITGKVPYTEHPSNIGIYRAIYSKKFPERPQELLGGDERQTQMWELLLKCWDYDPYARPDALSVLHSLQSFVS